MKLPQWGSLLFLQLLFPNFQKIHSSPAFHGISLLILQEKWCMISSYLRYSFPLYTFLQTFILPTFFFIVSPLGFARIRWDEKTAPDLLSGCCLFCEKATPFHKRGLRPAARILRTHWQAEKCFPTRTCRAGKRILLSFAAAATKLYEVLSVQSVTMSFLHRLTLGSDIPRPRRSQCIGYDPGRSRSCPGCA